LTKPALANGLRLACYTKAEEGLVIRIPEQESVQVETTFSTAVYPYQPLVERKAFKIAEPSLDDQRSDIERVLEACGAVDHSLSLGQLAKLPGYLRSRTEGVALIHNKTLIGFGAGGAHLLLAIDIGTTTVAATLFHLQEQRVVQTLGDKNAQAVFGADVISRIQHSISAGLSGIEQLQQAVVSQINQLKDTLLRQVDEMDDVSLITVTGNTSMMHFLCGLPAEHISKAPFISVTLDGLQLRPSEVGITSGAPLFIMPGISAYVGADIVASLIAADAHTIREPFLLIDFGTNAEIVLSTGDALYACSTAAGPCFEGATLSCGSVAQNGAIDSVFPVKGGFSFTTIGSSRATGMCGSAVIDCIALLLNSGDLDETGRLEGAGAFAEHVYEQDGEIAFHLTDEVYLSQGDIRKIQLAKAAVRAGVETLIHESGLSPSSLTRLFLAGGFGSALNGKSAERLGLIPENMSEITRVLGNAAGYGVLRYATEQDARKTVTDIKARTSYIELSAHAWFNEEYITQMTFPHGLSQENKMKFPVPGKEAMSASQH